MDMPADQVKGNPILIDDEDPTYNRDAEKAVLGAAILSPKAHDALMSLDPSDFYVPAHALIAGVLRDMVTRDIPIDQITVAAEIESRGKLPALRSVGGSVYLFAISEHAMPMSAPYYADVVRTAHGVRAAKQAGAELVRGTSDPQSAEYLQETLAKHRDRLDAIPGPLANKDDDDSNDTLGAMLAEQDTDTDWIIPGWLGRGERAVMVAGEGIAKTTMLRQFAVCLAGGLNPWTGQRVADGARVLFIDAENSRNQSRRAYRWIANRCYRPTIARGVRERLVHKTRNDGVNLIGADEKWFRDLADRINPDVIILSPAYKMMRGDPKEDRDVLALLDVIDKVRVAHNAAVLIETHAPHGSQHHGRDMRPFGSSVWLRWPEIGIGFQRDSATPAEFQKRRPEELETVDWRGAREPRDWPDRIRYGSPKELPWVPSDEFWKPSVDTNYVIPESEGSANV